jgi:hypothetical protein
MTTYQDPPLHSRRAARQGERADAQNTAANESAERAIAAGTAEPLNYATTSRPPLPQYDGQNLRPRRTVETVDNTDVAPTEASTNQQGYRSRDFSPEGRRSQPSWGPQYGGVGDDGTVEFHTQGREDVPMSVSETNAFPVAAPQAPASERVVSVPPVEHAEHTMTRRELRALREAGLITDVTDLSQPIVLPLPAQFAGEPAVPEPAAVQPEAPVADPPAPTWHAEVPAAVAPIADPIPLVAPTPQPSTRLDSALAEFDALASGREPLLPGVDAPPPVTGRRAAQVPTEPDAAMSAPLGADLFPQPEPLPPSTEGLSAFDALFQPPSAAIPVVVALPVDATVEHHDVVEAEIEPDQAPAAAPTFVHPLLLVDPLLVDPALADPLLTAPAPQGPAAWVPPPAAYPTPVDVAAPSATPSAPSPIEHVSHLEPTIGHWSTQADIDDAEQTNETMISRSVGAGNGAITTSALVLPSVPDHTIGGPLGDGGDILLTGSISLPESLSSLGAHPSQLDESDLDHLLDPGDHQVANTDSTPVRAIRAVSTHTASGGIISPSKPKGTRGFTILIIAASVMAVVVVGLLVVGLVSGTL